MEPTAGVSKRSNTYVRFITDRFIQALKLPTAFVSCQMDYRLCRSSLWFSCPHSLGLALRTNRSRFSSYYLLRDLRPCTGDAAIPGLLGRGGCLSSGMISQL